MDVLVAGGVMKRLDLAINDRQGSLDIPVLTEKCQQEECISVLRSLKLSQWRTGTQRGKRNVWETPLISVYYKVKFISVSTQKDYEQYKKNDIPI